MLINAKTEIIEHIGNRQVIAASVRYVELADPVNLMVGHSTEDYAEFLCKLDFAYNCRHWLDQQIVGTIWYGDSSWSEREYDDRYASFKTFENWVHYSVPQIFPTLFPREVML
jgi:hypothetical protein